MITATEDGILIEVRVIPRAARTTVDGTRAGALLVRLKAPPVEGAANAALIDMLATVLCVPKSTVSIAAGERSRSKRVRVKGITLERAVAILSPR